MLQRNLQAPLKNPCRSPVPTLEVSSLGVLTKAFRHKLWMDDVVSSLVGLHHMEAAVAATVERPMEEKDLSAFY